MPDQNLSPHTYSAIDLASLYLHRAGLPDTWVNQRILAAWFFAESSRLPGNNIRVYNNNPLNITTRTGTDYHTFSGISLHFVNYATPEQGADAWASLVKRSYPGIWTGLQHQDVAAVLYVIAQRKWGTSPTTFTSAYNSLPGLNIKPGDYTNIHDLTDSRPPAPTQLGAWYDSNGVPSVSFQEGHVLTDQDIETIVSNLDKQGLFEPAGGGPVQFLTGWMAKNAFSDAIRPFAGHQWNATTIKAMGAATGTAAYKANPANAGNPLGGLDGIAQSLNTISGLADPTKIVPRLFHIGGLLIGVAMMAYGVKLMIKASGASATAPNINIEVGGGGGGGAPSAGPYGPWGFKKVKQPAAPLATPETPAPTAPAAPKTPRYKSPPRPPTKARQREEAAQREFSQPVADNTNTIPGSGTFAPQKKAT